jgi:hypothetical protein
MSSNEELTVAVRAAAAERDGRIVLRCADAFTIAEEHSVEVGVIGQICNDINVRIVQCQLGCFK